MIAETVKHSGKWKIQEDQQLDFPEKEIDVSLETTPPDMFNGLSEEEIINLKKLVNCYSLPDEAFSELINLITSHSRKDGYDVDVLENRKNDQIIHSETTNQIIGEGNKCNLDNVITGYGGYMLDENISEMVMFPPSQPQARPSYAIHTVYPKIAETLAVPQEINSPFPVNVSDVGIATAVSPVNEHIRRNDSSINLALSAEEINSLKKKVLYQNIEPSMSDQKETCLQENGQGNNLGMETDLISKCFELSDNYINSLKINANIEILDSQCYAFCGNTNSPEHIAVEDKPRSYLENSMVESFSPKHQKELINCVNSPKGFNNVNVPYSSASPSLMVSDQMYSDSESSCGDISIEVFDTYSLHYQESNNSATSPALSSIFDPNLMEVDIDQGFAEDVNSNNASTISDSLASSPSSTYGVYTVDTNLMNVYSNENEQLPSLVSVSPYIPPQGCNNTVPLFDIRVCSPSSTVSSTYDLFEDNLMNSVIQCNPIEESTDVCAGSPFSTASNYGFYNENDLNLTKDAPAGELAKLPNISCVSQLVNTYENLEWLDDIDMCELDEAPKKQKLDDLEYKPHLVFEESQPKIKFLSNIVPKVNSVVKESERKSKRKFNSGGSDNKFVLQEYLKTESPLNHPVFNQDKDGDLPLHVLIAKGDQRAEDIIKIMDGHMLDTQNKMFQTPLHLASYLDDACIMDVLLQSGADPEIVDREGNNIIHHICDKGSSEMMKVVEQFYLTKNPNKVRMMMDTCNYEGLTPLHIDTKRYISKKKDGQDLKIIKSLLQLGCCLDIQDMKTGATVLAYALEYAQHTNDWELAKIFIEHGAKLNIPTFAGMQPLDYVCVSDNLVLAKDLILRGAESGIKNEFPNNKMKALVEMELRKRRRKRNRDNNLRKD